jgi:hypothetical protein
MVQKLKLTRDQFASFLQNHEQIKQFERLFATVDTIDTVTLDEISISAGNAEASANDALAQITRIADALNVAPPASLGTVTSVAASGGTTGMTFSGSPITTNGTLTLGGTLAVANGGTGATTLTGYVKGSGTSAFTASASVPAADVSGLATVATSGSFADLSNKPGIRSNGENVIASSTTLGSGDKGTNVLIVTSGITLTFPSSGYASGEGVAVSNVSGGSVTLSTPGGSDFGATLPNNGTFFAFCDGGGFWRQYCYSTTRL